MTLSYIFLHFFAPLDGKTSPKSCWCLLFSILFFSFLLYMNPRLAFASTTQVASIRITMTPKLLNLLDNSQPSTYLIPKQHLTQLITPSSLNLFFHVTSRIPHLTDSPLTSLHTPSQYLLLVPPLLPNLLQIRRCRTQFLILICFKITSLMILSSFLALNNTFMLKNPKFIMPAQTFLLNFKLIHPTTYSLSSLEYTAASQIQHNLNCTLIFPTNLFYHSLSHLNSILAVA